MITDLCENFQQLSVRDKREFEQCLKDYAAAQNVASPARQEFSSKWREMSVSRPESNTDFSLAQFFL